MDQPAVYLGLGSNLGDCRRNLAVALNRLGPLVRVDAVSSLYETDPVGPQNQPAYLNVVCRAFTGLPPHGLLRHARQVEYEIGRRRGEPLGPRAIDIDLLLYGDLVIDDAELRLPHAELAKRAFVLVPLSKLAADLRHPVLGETIKELARRVDSGSVRLLAELV